MLTITLATGTIQEVEEKIKGIFNSTNNTAILDEASALLLNRIRTRFLAETDPAGKKWLPSKASLRRAKSGRGGGTLYDTGRLFQSIQLARVGENQRRIGTDVYYAGWVNYGTVRLPRRIFMDFNEDDIGLVVKLIEKRIEKALA